MGIDLFAFYGGHGGIGMKKSITLDRLTVGHGGVLETIGGTGALRCRLLDMGLIPNTRVTVQKIAPMGDPMEIRLRGYELTLRLDDAARIEILPEVKDT